MHLFIYIYIFQYLTYYWDGRNDFSVHVLWTCQASSNSITCKPGFRLVVVYIDASAFALSLGSWQSLRENCISVVVENQGKRYLISNQYRLRGENEDADDAVSRVHFALCARDMMWFSERFYMWDAFVSLNLLQRSFTTFLSRPHRYFSTNATPIHLRWFIEPEVKKHADGKYLFFYLGSLLLVVIFILSFGLY